jgi:hypothetical protein
MLTWQAAARRSSVDRVVARPPLRRLFDRELQIVEFANQRIDARHVGFGSRLFGGERLAQPPVVAYQFVIHFPCPMLNVTDGVDGVVGPWHTASMLLPSGSNTNAP